MQRNGTQQDNQGRRAGDDSVRDSQCQKLAFRNTRVRVRLVVVMGTAVRMIVSVMMIARDRCCEVLNPVPRLAAERSTYCVSEASRACRAAVSSVALRRVMLP
jgi:hypothetical protein